MQRTRVGVLRGGPSSEYEVSLKTGSAVLAALSEERYEVRDIFIDKAGKWHLFGKPITPERALRQVDVVFNALHGEYGEDGQVQRVMDRLGVRYTGSGVLASAYGMHKLRAKEYARRAGIPTARHVVIPVSLDISRAFREVHSAFSPPWVVKPIRGGSSVGVALAWTPIEFQNAVREAFEFSSTVFVEEYISGREATVGVLEGFREEEYYTMLPIEIVPPKKKKFFDYEAKYTGISEERCPGEFTQKEKEQLQIFARAIHQALDARHYSRSDFIIHPKRGIYFLEINILPGLTKESLVPKAMQVAGCEFPELVEHLIGLAQKKRT